MKKTALAALMGFASLVGVEANAATDITGTFDVRITLTSKCEINSTAAGTGAVISNLNMTYTSFQTVAASGSTSFNVRCTNGLGYTLALDNTSVTDSMVDLPYTLALSATSGTGNGANQPFTVNGSIASGLAGNCSSTTGVCDNSLATNKTRTLTVTY